MADLRSSEARPEDRPTTSLRLAGAALVAAIAGTVGICLMMMALPALVAGAAIGVWLSVLTGSVLWLLGVVAIAVIAFVAYRYGQHRA